MLRYTISIQAAHGNVYHTAKQAMQDWEEGKDFQDMVTGAYFSCRDRGYMYLTLGTRWIDIRLSTGLYHSIQLSEGNH